MKSYKSILLLFAFSLCFFASDVKAELPIFEDSPTEFVIEQSAPALEVVSTISVNTFEYSETVFNDVNEYLAIGEALPYVLSDSPLLWHKLYKRTDQNTTLGYSLDSRQNANSSPNEIPDPGNKQSAEPNTNPEDLEFCCKCKVPYYLLRIMWSRSE